MSELLPVESGASGFALPFGWDNGILLKDKSVNVSGLDEKLVNFLRVAHRVHLALFQLPLCVTSGNDGAHAVGSKHYKFQAVDLRNTDLSEAGQTVFLVCLTYLAFSYAMSVFDERYVAYSGHIHIEVAN